VTFTFYKKLIVLKTLIRGGKAPGGDVWWPAMENPMPEVSV